MNYDQFTAAAHATPAFKPTKLDRLIEVNARLLAENGFLRKRLEWFEETFSCYLEDE